MKMMILEVMTNKRLQYAKSILRAFHGVIQPVVQIGSM